MAETDTTARGERVAKVIARAGLCSRRDAEKWIAEGRVTVDGETLTSPAFLVDATNEVRVDGEPLPARERPRLWRYHKPKGLITTRHDPQGRRTIFEALPKSLPRVITVGRLDLTSEGLLLLTNDGALARTLELPASGWTRRYRVRAFGTIEPKRLAALASGVVIDRIRYGPVTATLDRSQGRNHWLTLSLREGKNREVRRVCEHLGLAVSRLIRVAFGPFQLGELEPGEVREVPLRVLREQLGQETASRLVPARRAARDES
jgi:23S rRNA pseudouridine2605 synthase